MLDPKKLLQAAPKATLTEARRWLTMAATDLGHARHLLECGAAPGGCQGCEEAEVSLGYRAATLAE